MTHRHKDHFVVKDILINIWLEQCKITENLYNYIYLAVKPIKLYFVVSQIHTYMDTSSEVYYVFDWDVKTFKTIQRN